VRLANYHERRGEYEQAQHCIWRQLELEPWREESHRQLMRVLAVSGQRSAALVQYETCRRVLERDLSVELEAETTALYLRIRDGASSELPTPTREAQNVQNFPTQATRLIGRETELSDLGALLENPACRLITITGPGGVGKTRLALAAAAEQAEVFANGATFVPLQAISSATFLAPAILSALDIPLQGQREPREQLLDELRRKELLLVLDNFEQLLTSDLIEDARGVALLTDMLQRAPGVTLLITSRERLALPGEWLFDLPGLSYPLGEPTEAIDTYSAVQLFVQRASQVRRQVAFAGGEARAVARICWLVEGLPLAIELAAAALRGRSCIAIADAIETSSMGLASGLRAIPERHRSMWATFEYSWRLLSDEERQVFPRLTVFRGGFEEDAAAQVAQASPQLLTALLDKSLLRWDGVARYDLHVLVRQYASEKLERAGETVGTRNQHTAYYLALTEQSQSKPATQEEPLWLDQFEVEHNNLRAALAWRLSQQDRAAVVYMCERLWGFWRARGYLSEARKWLEPVLTARDTLLPPICAQTLLFAGDLAHHSGDLASAAVLLEQSLALYRELADTPNIARLLLMRGHTAYVQCEMTMARLLYEQSLALYRDLADRWGMVWALKSLGVLALSQGDVTVARAHFEEKRAIEQELGVVQTDTHTDFGDVAFYQGAYEIARRVFDEDLTIQQQCGNRPRYAALLRRIGVVDLAEGKLADASERLNESLALFRELRVPVGVANTLVVLGTLALLSGDIGTARTRYAESLEVYHAMGRQNVSGALQGLGKVAQHQGDSQQATRLFVESLALASKSNDKLAVCTGLEHLAGVAAEQEQTERAVQLWGAAEALRETNSMPLWHVDRPDYERRVAIAHTQMGESAFAAAWAEGRAMSLNQAIAQASSLDD
jgi:predicted ATPase